MEFEFGFIGWCHNTYENHDKVWGYFYRPTPDAEGRSWINKENGWNCCIFWGRRGKAMQFKAATTGGELHQLTRSKFKKGYARINHARLNEIWPSFEEEAKMKLSYEVLCGNVK